MPYTLRKRDRIIAAVNSRVRKATQKYGIEVPTSIAHAKHIDEKNSNTFLADAIHKEMTNVAVTFEKPRQPEHGDLTTNIALILAKKIGKNSRELAREILNNIDLDKSLVPKAEQAGPGFLNFSFSFEEKA